MAYYNTEFGYSVVGAWGLRNLVSGWSSSVARIRDPFTNVESDVDAATIAAYTLDNLAYGSAFSWTTSSDSTGWSNETFRVKIPVSLFTAIGKRAKFTFKTGSTGAVVTHATVALGQAADVALVGTIIDCKFSGNDGITVGANTFVTTDEFDLPDVVPGQYIVVSIHLSSGSFTRANYVTGYVGGYFSGDYTHNPSASGFNTGGITGNVITDFQVRGYPFIVKYYDQSGNGAHWNQATAASQAMLVPQATPAGAPVARHDGLDDFTRDDTAGTTRPYMVAKPVVVCLTGARTPREQYARTWNIPQADGANSSPYYRIGIEQVEVSTLDFMSQTRVNGNQTVDLKLAGMNNLKGWGAHAMVPQLGKFYQAGYVDQNIDVSATITYPNSTRMYIGANGLGTENNGMDFVELVVMDTSSANAVTIQAALDKIAYETLYGNNIYYRLEATGTFSPDNTDGGMAEFEAHATIGGADLTAPTTPFIANRRYNGTESWEKAVDNNNSTYYSSGGGSGVSPKLYFVLDSAVLIAEVSIKARADSFYQYTIKKYKLAKFGPTGWVEAQEVDNTADGNSAGQTYVDSIVWGNPDITKTFTFDYSIAASPFTRSFEFDYRINSSGITQSFAFDYEIKGPITASFQFDYKIQLWKSFTFSYKIEQDSGDVLGYRHIIPAQVDSPKRVFTYPGTASKVNDAEIIGDVGPVTYPVSVPLADDETFNHLNFYADYYERIWVTPESIRLSNPKIGFEYPFNVWNAYDRPNTLTTYIPTTVDGVSFVELGSLPLVFKAVQFRVMHFSIGQDAPSQIEGNLFFDFTMGGDGFDLFALVLGVLKTLPNEPFKEVWSWATVMETSRNGTEQRQALRDQPRTQAAYEVQILDEEDRRIAYQQLYSFATRTVLVPFFQYMTRLDADANIGDTRLYFDLSKSDIRADEYLVIFQPQTDLYSIIQVASLNADGVNLMTPLTFDLDRELFEVLPGRLMRLPNKSAFSMEAVNGQLSFKGESTSWRELLRPGGTVTLPSYDGYPVLPYKPIAATMVDETFDSDVEVIDNNSTPPIVRSTFTNPFIESVRQYFVDREEEMDWWRNFFDYTKGMLRPFLLPTWRNDLPLVETPVLGDNELVTSVTDYADYWPYQTYRWIQIQSDSGVIYRQVESVEIDGDNLVMSLDENIGLTVGSNENLIVSFLNLARLNADEVGLDHFVNHTIITVPTRTVNQ